MNRRNGSWINLKLLPNVITTNVPSVRLIADVLFKRAVRFRLLKVFAPFCESENGKTFKEMEM